MTDNKNKEPYINMVSRVLDPRGQRWYLNGKLHREDGPAIIFNNGTQEWWLNGKLHREDGPAVEFLGGHRGWYKNGLLHREDGPAVERPNGHKAWYLNGIKYSEEEYELMRFFRMGVFDKNC